jgi:hypothetical protein
MRTQQFLIGLGWSILGSLPLAACSAGAPPAPAAPAVQEAPVERGTLLADVFSAYPRLVRQAAHSNPALNGRLVASMTSGDPVGSVAAIYGSSDDGKHFTRIGSIADPDFKAGMCCGTLYELPVQIGALPAGTLLYASSVGADRQGMAMENRIYRSADGGVNWSYLSLCGKGRIAKTMARPSGIWEPEFSIAASGELVCHYSDETLDGHSQVLVQVNSRDGLNWTAPQLTVATDDPNGRPGMAVVRKLPNGSYFMTYENCYAGPLDCTVHAKRSPDGLNWGAPNDPGPRLETASGQFLRHAPTMAWAPQAGQPNGALLVIGQIVVDKNGTPDAGSNGKAMFINTSADGSGPWRLMATPIAIPAPPLLTNWCQNYSSALLPSADGKSLGLMQSDGGAGPSCRMRYGSAALAP